MKFPKGKERLLVMKDGSYLRCSKVASQKAGGSRASLQFGGRYAMNFLVGNIRPSG